MLKMFAGPEALPRAECLLVESEGGELRGGAGVEAKGREGGGVRTFAVICFYIDLYDRDHAVL